MLNTAIVASTPIKSFENDQKKKAQDTTISKTSSSADTKASSQLSSADAKASSASTPNLSYTDYSEPEYSTIVSQVMK